MSATKTAAATGATTSTKQPAKAGAKASISACSQGSKLCEDAIREKAYLKWEKAGYPPSDGVQFWLEAESELAAEAAE
jgi:hypothetical protein